MAGSRGGRGSAVWLVAVAMVVGIGFYLFAGSETTLVGQSEAVVETADSTNAVANATQTSNLNPVLAEQLPAEAVTTLELIAQGGPYPFSRDDSVFQNREQLLPDRPRGHYREYTVITPGEDDRGARRIVAGADGELYYTSDHYQSFNEIVGALP